MYDVIHAAVIHLIRTEQVRSDSFAGLVYFVLHGIHSEARARELAAALHACLYGNPEPLTHEARAVQ
ncbi:hypothetical protein [Streptomyces sp. NPDC093594]|uniref:hypothetical protein n=2 Tax=unclassified Streptomyces TaxID=2593676 RepID=UPI00344BA3FE